MISTKFIIVESMVISYIEKNSIGKKTIFFFHGNSNSCGIWKKQFDSTQLAHYRLIAFDLPSHGNSSGMINPVETYNVIAIGAIMAKAASQLCCSNPYIFLGFSLGTNIIAEMLAFNTTPLALAMAGSSIVGSSITTSDVVISTIAAEVLFADQPELNTVKEYINQSCLSVHDIDRLELIEDYYKVKSPFRSTLKKSIGAGIYSDEIKLVKKSILPVLVVYGKDEKITPNNLLDNLPFNCWQNQVFKINNASHTVMLDQPAIFNTLLLQFLKDIF